jgi:hypothetical protein
MRVLLEYRCLKYSRIARKSLRVSRVPEVERRRARYAEAIRPRQAAFGRERAAPASGSLSAGFSATGFGARFSQCAAT